MILDVSCVGTSCGFHSVSAKYSYQLILPSVSGGCQLVSKSITLYIKIFVSCY